MACSVFCTWNKLVCYVLVANTVFVFPDFQILHIWSFSRAGKSSKCLMNKSIGQSVNLNINYGSSQWLYQSIVNQQSETLVVIDNYERSARILIEEMLHACLYFYLNSFFSDWPGMSVEDSKPFEWASHLSPIACSPDCTTSPAAKVVTLIFARIRDVTLEGQSTHVWWD